MTWAPVATRGRRTAATRTSSPPSSPMAIRRPSSVRGARRSRSRSRTVLTSSGSPWRGVTRRSSRNVDAPRMPSTGRPGVALEVGQGLRAEVAEDAVHPTGVEAEGRQASLQVGDVVAAQHGPAEVEEPVPEAQARPRPERPRSGGRTRRRPAGPGGTGSPRPRPWSRRRRPRRRRARRAGSTRASRRCRSATASPLSPEARGRLSPGSTGTPAAPGGAAPCPGRR